MKNEDRDHLSQAALRILVEESYKKTQFSAVVIKGHRAHLSIDCGSASPNKMVRQVFQ